MFSADDCSTPYEVRSIGRWYADTLVSVPQVTIAIFMIGDLLDTSIGTRRCRTLRGLAVGYDGSTLVLIGPVV
jgi:hypothetical protein